MVAERYPLDFVLSYCHYTLLDATLANWLPVFAARGLGVINASPLSMGLLAEAEPPPWHPAPPEIRRAVAEIKAYCRAQGVDLPALALQFSLHHPGIATTLVGMVNREQLRRNLEAVGTPPDERHVEAIRVILGTTRDLSWSSGRPENS
jgi:L-galactose dehydrogenase